MTLIEEFGKAYDDRMQRHIKPRHVWLDEKIYQQLKREECPYESGELQTIRGLRIFRVKDLKSPIGSKLRWIFDGTKYK